ncbi:16071_t:CDS:1, partial [Funneliformis geosporum]
MRLTLPRAEAMALIRHNLTSANNELTELEQSSSERLPEGSEMDIESSSSEEELLPKRHKLRHVIATSNVSSDIAPMEDFFDTMSEEEIFRYK